MKFNFKNRLVVGAFFLISFFSCKKGETEQPTVITPPVVVPPVIDQRPALPTTLAGLKAIMVDKNATDESAALFYNMKNLAKTKIMFGHQDDTHQGVSNATTAWNGIAGKSDVKEVTGAYPAVYGWDMIFVASFQRNGWFDNQANETRNLTADAYKRGGINTYAWHYWNPALSKRPGFGGPNNEGLNADFYYDSAPTAAVSQILPGGNYNLVYNQSLDQVATYIKSLVDDNGKPIPVIFRLFHEMDGNWFWWGASHCSPQEYKDLFQYTVKYLRDTKQIHNVLYSWSPDRSATTEAAYLSRYPGDDCVDVLGIDNYEDLKTAGGITAASNKLKIMSDYAIKNNKIAALTEMGLKNVTQNNWYTTVLLPALTQQKLEISYALAWSNSVGGYWTPYRGHPAETDFINFKNSSQIVFGDKMPNMYTIK